ncbi:capsid protein [Lentilactobacillus senioris]|uniref:capsid protein n=1 Tax=Lentilactobacillus senioris TaxID=931534 RepID=UPI00227EAD26|nr:capsid protein [Lentilactobacillus senioris]MCY9807464.1 capsid protein [Lentilactobacillus senioris]
MAVLNYADKYQQAIAEAFYDENLRSAALWNSPSNTLVSFDGAKHIKVPTLTIDEGRRDRSRATITAPTANYSNDWDSYTLSFDRYWETLVDPLDVDETNMVTSIANVTRAFNLQQKLPEMDRYMFSRLYEQKNEIDSTGIHTETLDEANILEAFDTMMANFDEKRVPSQGRLLYVTPQVNKILKSAEAKNRMAEIAGNGNITRMVYSLDDVQLVVVPSDLMQSAYDFAIGAKTKDDAQQINLILIYNGAQIAPQKYSFVGMDAPSAATSGNYHYYEQAYADVFILKEKAAGVEMYTSAKATTPETPAKTSAKTK